MKPRFPSLSQVPRKPGVYLFYAAADKPIYVGKAKDLKARLSSYLQQRDLPLKTVRMLELASRLDYLVTASELDALMLESSLIKKYQPRYNVSLRDDKRYPYLKLTLQEEWPRLLVVRRKIADGAKYFGPYQAGTIRQTLKLLKRLFPLRWCRAAPLKPRKQPCLYYSMKRCVGPCLGQVDRRFYLTLCADLASFLEGDTAAVLKELENQMAQASQQLRFEEARSLREVIRSLQKITREVPLVSPDLEEKEMVSLLRFVNRKEGEVDWAALESLKRALGLAKIPLRIECFDVSNLGGTAAVGSLVVFEGGRPLSQDYRHFRLRRVSGPNDVASMAEIVGRRYCGTQRGKLARPDLVLVDGGVGQARAAWEEIKKAGLDLPVFGLAKKEERIYPPEGKGFSLSPGSAALRLLQHLRDEAHRFAVAYHRRRRSQQFLGKNP